MNKLVNFPSNLTACVLALILGASGVFAYSPFDFWGVAYLSALGLIWVATLERRKTALWATFAWSIGYFCTGVSWIHVSMIQFGGVPEIVSYLAVFLLACYLGLYNVLFAFVANRFRLRNPFVLAAVFTLTEYLRGVAFTNSNQFVANAPATIKDKVAKGRHSILVFSVALQIIWKK